MLQDTSRWDLGKAAKAVRKTSAVASTAFIIIPPAAAYIYCEELCG